ncbi:hypothetical protein FZ934_04225 [Rhizobium grahamii]|uniref:Uncharacterized protein n=1 Tax=Rhizobium grahamii TaxID=1120045 RepID=A0A5Q0C1G9_9HYPH|nr:MULTISPECIES: hypothetical protein [Rhizobium]QFY59708.1 hypothetical protein FZ934_04225 [Rhizobium grahamii]QRM51179.1 hypothetical protein F3Y33_18665 [Rhizobium sp. BG6]
MTSKRKGSHLWDAVQSRTENELYQPQLTITEKELFANVSVKGGGIYQADFSEAFRKRPEITRAIATGFIGSSNGKAKSSVKKDESHAKLFLTTFLDGLQKSFGQNVAKLAQLNGKIGNDYLEWLSGEFKLATLPSAKGILGETSIPAIYNRIRLIVEFLSTSPSYSKDVNGVIFKPNPKPGSHKAIKHREALSEADMRLLIAACQREIRRTIKQLEYGDTLKERPDPRLDVCSWIEKKFYSLDACIQAYLHADKIRAWEHGSLATEMRGFERATHGRKINRVFIREHLHFTSATIIPFVILLEMTNLFAVDSHILLTWDDVGDALTSDKRGRIEANKPRGDVLQVRTFRKNDPYYFSSHNLLRLLNKHTAYTRTLVDPKFSRRIFLFVDGQGRPKAFTSQNESRLFYKCLMAFIKRNKLKHFSLSQLKSTAPILVGADINAASELLHHEQIRTTQTHYDPAAAKRVRREKIAFEMAVRERNLATLGKSDTRGKGLTKAEKTAVTPGFLCIEPLNSPYRDQIPGRMCTAYGRCPACPNATVDCQSSKAAYRLAELLSLLNDHRFKCLEARWLVYWKPQVDALRDFWLRNFDPNAIAAAANLKLSPLPEID